MNNLFEDSILVVDDFICSNFDYDSFLEQLFAVIKHKNVFLPYPCQLVSKFYFEHFEIPNGIDMKHEEFGRVIVKNSKFPEDLRSKFRFEDSITVKIEVPIELSEPPTSALMDSKKYFFYERARIKFEYSKRKLENYNGRNTILKEVKILPLVSTDENKLKEFISLFAENAPIKIINWDYFWHKIDDELQFKLAMNEKVHKWQYMSPHYLMLEEANSIRRRIEFECIDGIKLY